MSEKYVPPPDRTDDPAGRSRHLLDAQWFYRLGFAAGRTIPKAVLYRAADLIGGASRRAAPAKDRAVQQNLRRVFPDAPQGELAKISRRIFRNFTRYLVDYGRFRSMTPEAILAEIPRFEGEDNLRRAVASGKGIVVVTGHIGNWELGGCFFAAQKGIINVVGISDGRREIDELRDEYRKDHKVRTIFVDKAPFAAFDMMSALNRGEVVAMLIDRWKPEGAVQTAFFGGSCYLPRGPLALSRATGALVMASFVVRDGDAYRGIVEEPFVVDGGDDAVYARRLAHSLEKVISRYPDQWYNFAPLP